MSQIICHVRRTMMAFLLGVCPFLLLLSVGAAEGAGESARHDWQTKEWHEVLRLASSRSEGSYDKLRAIAAQESEAVHVALARQILSLWDPKANTFYSSVPHIVRRVAVDVSALRALFPGTTTSNLLVIHVDVDASGAPSNVRIAKGPNNPAYRELVKQAILESSFCPAKKGDTYVDGTVTLTYSLEVR